MRATPGFSLRALLMYGAYSLNHRAKNGNPWLQKMLAGRPLNVIVVALANKMARKAWVLVAHGCEYEVGGAARTT